MFTAKVYKYPSGYQVRIYERGVIEKSKGDFYPGETQEPEKVYNPFEEKWEHISEFPDPERSARVSLTRTKQMIYYLSRSNVFQWFVTLTFNPEKVDSFDYRNCARHLSDWLSNAKKRCPEMKYIVVPELHKSGRYHFHGLFADCDDLGFVDSGHRSKGDVIYNIGSYRLGFTTATRIKDMNKVSRYISKYITKGLVSLTKGRRRYWASKNLKRAEIKPMIIEVGKRQALCAYLSKRASYVKECRNIINSVTYFEFTVSDLDLVPFVRLE